jgi:hypothetical protein
MLCHLDGVFTLGLTAKQVQARRGYVVVWESQGKVSRVTFELKEPSDSATETVLKSLSLKQFGEKLFGGFGDRGARLEFTKLGTLTRILPID